MLKTLKGFLNREVIKNEEVVVLEDNISMEENVEILNEATITIEQVEEEVSLESLMTELSSWRRDFIGRKKFLNNRLNEIDNEIREIRKAQNFDSAKFYRLKAEKSKIVEEKKIIRLLDLDDEFSYHMIGRKISNYNFYLTQEKQEG